MEHFRQLGRQNDSYLKLGDKKKMFIVCIFTESCICLILISSKCIYSAI